MSCPAPQEKTVPSPASFKISINVAEDLGEEPLAEIDNAKDFKAWLKEKPREVAVVLAARAALRVLPIVQTAKGDGTERKLVLPVFRATAVSWAAANYPVHQTNLAAAARAASNAATVSATVLAVLAYPSFPVFYDVFFGGLVSITAFFVSLLAFVAAVFAVLAALAVHAVRAVRSGFAERAAAYASAAVPFFWSAVSGDATRLEEGATASDIAGSPLWPNSQPD